MNAPARVLDRLALVHDPEVDEPVTEMGFIRAVEASGDDVVVHMQLPTYFCAPNFTWLMVDDVRRAAESVVGAGHVRVELEGHFESERISDAVSRNQSFADAFREQAEADLEGIRDQFQRKTLLIRQEHVCRGLDELGIPAEELCDLELIDVAGLGVPTFGRYLTTRGELGISCRHDDPFLVAADGRPVGPDRLRAHRRSASVMAISFEGNGHLCRALISQRYPTRTDITTQGDVA